LAFFWLNNWYVLHFHTCNHVRFFSNLLLLVSLCRKPRLKSFTNLLIGALAVTDLINASIPGVMFCSSLVSSVSFIPSKETSSKMVLGVFGCFISGFFLHLLTYASMSTMVLTALNRFYCVLKPHKHKVIFSHLRSMIYIASVWFFVAIVEIFPMLFSRSTIGFSSRTATCVMICNTMEVQVGYTAFIVAFFVVLCFCTICFCYFCVS
ncbi:melatonin receptor type 1B-like, partial [Stylophora pistillata]|uniref:melatonin receptor type 1B-like n=1 Tax=Stylophora pistillata TaxID=50429 RepID=UPI000C0469A1